MTFYKDPDATLDYTVDWSDWLDGDTISTSMWIVPAGITEVSDSHTASIATVFLSSGVVGTIYEVTNRITTAGGRTNDRSFRLGIRHQ